MIPLNKHGVIEAHAGTGKTYTIVQMVLRMLCEALPHKRKGVANLNQILLVTYTEKAAGELKARLRKGLEKEIAERSNESTPNIALIQHLQFNLDNLEDAWIGTIHSICQKILSNYPFETHTGFQSEMVDDNKGITQLFRNMMRTQWAENSIINKSLQILALEQQLLSEEMQKAIIDTSATITDPTAKILQIDNVVETIQTLCNNYEHHNKLLPRSKELLILESRDFLEYLSSIQFDNYKLDEKQVNAWVSRKNDLKQQLLSHNIQRDTFKEKFGTNSLLKKADCKHQELQKLDEMRTALFEHEYFLHNSEITKILLELNHLLCFYSAQVLADQWRNEKSKLGVVSFNDLLSITRQSVCQNQRIKQALREQFCYAIIDEFQDTSLLQWDLFRTLFVGDQNDIPNPASSLFLVGDPKQSIYSFQGANVDTYLQAVSLLTQKKESLTSNYRSLPTLIKACNQVFEDDNEIYGTQVQDWWLMNAKLNYPNASSSKAPTRTPESANQDTSLNNWLEQPIRATPLFGSAPILKQKWANFIGQSIQGLVGREFQSPAGDSWASPRPLEFSDFAILTETNYEAQIFIETLAKQGIPAMKYKQTGIFESEMARQIRIWFEAIDGWDSHPELLSKVLVTAIANISPHTIHNQVVDTPHPAVQTTIALLTRWQMLAQERRWPQLFASIRCESSIETNLALLADADRQISDLRQILEHCHEFLSKGGATLADLIEHLRNLMNGTEQISSDANIHQKESDAKAVQVMTMHASKGLQFPIVYLATKKPRTYKAPRCVRWVQSDDHNSGLKCFPLIFNKNGVELINKYALQPYIEICTLQESQEKQRLYYVALTRAQILLFVPILNFARKSGGVTNYSQSDSLSKKLDAIIKAKHPSTLICEHSANLHLPPVNDQKQFTTCDTLADLPVIEPHIQNPITIQTSKRQQIEESYTSLTHGAHIPARDIDKSQERANDTDTPLSEISTSITTKKLDLPKGKQIGIAWHGILEQLLIESNLSWIKDYSADSKIPAHLEAIFAQQLKQHGVFQQARQFKFNEALVLQKTQEICINAIKMPLTWANKNNANELCEVPALASLSKLDRLPEVEFHLNALLQNLHVPSTILGFIDLVFRVPIPNSTAKHPYRYFVLDWKSNWLNSYDMQSMEESILHERYNDQAQLYNYALHLWLHNILGDKYSAEQNLGGALYLYLRCVESCTTSIPVWHKAANPVSDHERVLQLLNAKQGVQ